MSRLIIPLLITLLSFSCDGKSPQGKNEKPVQEIKIHVDISKFIVERCHDTIDVKFQKSARRRSNG